MFSSLSLYPDFGAIYRVLFLLEYPVTPNKVLTNVSGFPALSFTVKATVDVVESYLSP